MFGAGQSIGNYRILSKIGTGGMGAVYLAEHPLIGKKVALKVIHRELAGNREVVQRFFQEARAVNTIGNEHIVEIHDFGVTPEGDHFIIMEYLQGQTLASVLSHEKSLEIMRALHVTAQISSALGAAHASGIIHRDLKPDNVMLLNRLGDPDFVKVLDFGLAKMFEHGSVLKTAAGVLLGTPQYMSPEACESRRDIDHRTDIYALGVLMFQMLTGQLPFDGESMGEVLVKQVTALPPAPRGVNPRIPPSVEQILLRCLAKPPDARFQSMQALREALLDPEGYLRASPPIAPARSVAPGEARVDAKTMIAETGHAAMQKTRMAMEPPRGQAAYAPTAAHPIAAAPGGMAATMIADGGPLPSPRRMPTGALMIPGLAPPMEPVNHTMRIATPLGHSSRQSRKMWPIVLGLGLVLGLGAGTIAVVMRDKTDAPAALGDQDGGEPVAAPVDAAQVAAQIDGAQAAMALPDASDHALVAVDAAVPVAAVVDAAPTTAPAATAKLTIDSIPHGATVHGPNGAPLGKTPLKLEWPISTETVLFELRLAGYRKKPKQVVVGGNTTMRVELERLPRPAPAGSGNPPPAGSGGSGDGLMRPE